MATEEHVHTQVGCDTPSLLSPLSAYPTRKLVYATSVSSGQQINDTASFTVLSYNLLAQCYILKSRYPYTKDLSQEFRHTNLMKELISVGVGTVVCFQEVTQHYFSSLLEPAMNELGYLSVFKLKSIKRVGALPSKDGLAIFYDMDRVELLGIYPLEMNALLQDVWVEMYGPGRLLPNECYKDTVALAVVLRVKSRVIVVGTTHVPWSQVCWDVQSLQVSLMLRKLADIANKHQSNGYIMCGDFNRKPKSELYQLITSGELTQSQRDFFLTSNKKLIVSILPDPTQCVMADESLYTDSQPYYKVFEHYYSIPDPMRSAYATVLGTEPHFTFYADSQGCMDYIFYCPAGIDAVEALDMPSEEAICSEVALPNSVMPSDHISIKAGFKFV